MLAWRIKVAQRMHLGSVYGALWSKDYARSILPAVNTFGATLLVPYRAKGCRDTVSNLDAVRNIAWVDLLKTASWFSICHLTITYETEEMQNFWDMRKFYLYHMLWSNFNFCGITNDVLHCSNHCYLVGTTCLKKDC